MKNKILVLLILCIGLTFFSYAQSTSKINTKFYGFVKVDYMFDSRQTIYAREGHFNILPKEGKEFDKSNINFLAIQSRVGVKISGPDFFGFKTSGVVEGAFFGNSNPSIGEFRLRHAFVKLSNNKIDILMGQYWHPMFVTAVFPGTYSFNTGVPFQPFSRNPQLRITTKGNLRFIGVLFTERDFKTRGASVSQSGVPQVHAQLQLGNKSDILAGLGANLKTVRPSLKDKNISAFSFIGYLTAKISKTTFKAEAVYGENMSDLLQIGGFGVNTKEDFINSKTLSLWTEFSGDFSKTMEWGLFGGYTGNNGFGETVTYKDGFLVSSVKEAWRVSPRIGWKSGKMKIGLEGEYTSANYGTIKANGDIKGNTNAGNFRLLATAIYKF